METRVTVHTQSKTTRHLHLCPGVGFVRFVPGARIIFDQRLTSGWPAADQRPCRWACKALCAHVFENLHRDQVSLSAPRKFLRKVLSFYERVPRRSTVWSTWLSKKKIPDPPKGKEKKAQHCKLALKASKALHIVVFMAVSSCPWRASSF